MYNDMKPRDASALEAGQLGGFDPDVTPSRLRVNRYSVLQLV